MYKGNSEIVMRDATVIVDKLRYTNITLEALYNKYHCTYTTIVKAILTVLSPAQWKQLVRDRRKKVYKRI